MAKKSLATKFTEELNRDTFSLIERMGALKSHSIIPTLDRMEELALARNDKRQALVVSRAKTHFETNIRKEVVR